MNAWEEKLSGEGDTPLLLPKTAGQDCAYLLIFKGFRLILNPCSWKREMNPTAGGSGKAALGAGRVLVFCGNGISFIRQFSLEAGRSGFLSFSFRTNVARRGVLVKLPEFGFLEKCKIVGKTLLVQIALFITLLLLAWGSQALYAKLDRTEFPTPVQITDADKLDENAKGKALVDAITHQMRYELDSTFGWSINDILFNRFVLDNRAYRQYGVYHATKVLMDLYSMTIAKLGTNDRESEMLYKARLNSFAIDPRSFMFPSAESSYKKGSSSLNSIRASTRVPACTTAGPTTCTPPSTL